MVQKLIKTVAVIFGCILLASCGGERRVDGEMAFDSDSLMTMADSFMKAGDYGNAMRLYQRAANENPRHIPSRLGLARTYLEMGASDASINFYQQVLKLDPNNMEAKKGIGQMLITKNRSADAIPYLTDILNKDPSDYRIYNMLGLAYDLMGDQKNAQMSYGNGLNLAPDNISLLNNLALSFAFESQYAPSIQLLSKAINLDYSVTKAQQNLVMVYVLSGEEEMGRAIGDTIMTKEEIDNNIRRYQWVKTLTPAERAQAIFLGMKNFPSEEKSVLDKVLGGDDKQAATAREERPLDPKKRQLFDILNQDSMNKGSQESATLSQEASSAQEPQKDVVASQKAPEEMITVAQEKANKALDTVEKKKSENIPTSEEPATIENEGPRPKVYRVQLGSYPNAELAGKGWQDVKSRGEEILRPYEPLIKSVTLDQDRILFRLFIDKIEEEAMARDICNQLQAKKIDCLVLKTDKD